MKYSQKREEPRDDGNIVCMSRKMMQPECALPPGGRMNCRMGRGVYLRANGDINCYCSTGEQVLLAQLPPESQGWDFVSDVYLKGSFQRIREHLKKERLPFPNQCLKCNYLSPAACFDEDLVPSEIEWMHIEPAAICNLSCPYCVHGIPKKNRTYSRSGPNILSETLYNKILEDIKRHGMNIRWMYFSGRGEPGLHSEIWRMVRKAKSLFDTNFLVNTNGNIAYCDDIVTSGLDKIKIALDSLDQEIYARYRIGGSVEKIVNLTKEITACKKRLGSHTPLIIWQKVLQNYNDSKEELIQYQQAALDHGVDRIRFVYTFTRDYGVSRAEDLPRIFPDIDILDCKERDDMSPDILRKRRAEALADDSLAGHIRLASDILHWFQMGMPDRDAYDAFARADLGNPATYSCRRDDTFFAEYMMTLRLILSSIARLYDDRGEEAASAFYHGVVRGTAFAYINSPLRNSLFTPSR
ncbi:MAG: radical SAM protein [Thermodesulfobacteriota bacterium]